MNIFSFILTIIMSALMIASNTIASVIPGIIPEAKTEEELLAMADVFDKYELAEDIYVVNGVGSKDERAAIHSLQGLISRDKATIYVNYEPKKK